MLTGPYSALSLSMDRDKYGPVHVQGQAHIRTCPCPWTETSMALSMYRDKTKSRPVNVHGHDHIQPCPCSTSSNRIIISRNSNKGQVP